MVRMTHSKWLGFGLLVMLSTAFAACSLSDFSYERSKLVSEILDVQIDISAQLLKLETDRDALALGAGSVNCSPEESRATYQKVTAKLRSISDEGTRLKIAGSFQADIEGVIEEWSTLERRHDSFWRDSADTANLSTNERCMRPTALALTRLTIEKKIIAAAKAALPHG